MTTTPSFRTKMCLRLIAAIPIAPLLMIGEGWLSIHGSKAQALSLPFASLLAFAPSLAVGVYLAGGLLLRARFGIFAWIAAYVLGGTIICAPQFIVSRYGQAIPVTRWLTRQEKAELHLRFAHPFVHYSSSGEGVRILVRRSDYDASLLEFLRSIHAYTDA